MDAPLLPTRKCPCCKALFVPVPQCRATQRFCSAAVCRRASKDLSNRRWRKANPGYDSGPHQVARVQRWRRDNPGYGRGKRRKKPGAALQDLDPTQAVDTEPLAKIAHGTASDLSPGAGPSFSCNGPQNPSDAVALQDSAPIQLPLVVGLMATLMGDALQEDLGSVSRQLVEKGCRVLAQNPGLLGFLGASKNTQFDLQL